MKWSMEADFDSKGKRLRAMGDATSRITVSLVLTTVTEDDMCSIIARRRGKDVQLEVGKERPACCLPVEPASGMFKVVHFCTLLMFL